MEKIFELLKNYWKIGVVGLLALVAGGIFYLVSHPSAPANTLSASNLPSVSADRNAEPSKISLSAPSDGLIMVDVKGAVMKPAVYKVSANLRLDDVIKLAGGFAPDADQKTVNLAAKLKDEEVIYVARVGEEVPAISTGAGASDSSVSTTLSSGPQDKVNINTADLTALQTLSGIGAKRAQDIIDYRTQNGLFKSVDDLTNVSGFGPKTLEKLRDSICVD